MRMGQEASDAPALLCESPTVLHPEGPFSFKEKDRMRMGCQVTGWPGCALPFSSRAGPPCPATSKMTILPQQGRAEPAPQIRSIPRRQFQNARH